MLKQQMKVHLNEYKAIILNESELKKICITKIRETESIGPLQEISEIYSRSLDYICTAISVTLTEGNSWTWRMQLGFFSFG